MPRAMTRRWAAGLLTGGLLLTGAVLPVTSASASALASAPSVADKPKPCAPPPPGYAPVGGKHTTVQDKDIVNQGGTVTLTFTGLQPGSSVSITIDPNMSFGPFEADGNGRLVAKLKLANNAKIGKTHIHIKGTDSDCKKFVEVRDLRVVAKGAVLGIDFDANGNPIVHAPKPAVGGLAFTGAEIAGISVVGLGLLGAGGALVVATRRRRSAPLAA